MGNIIFNEGSGLNDSVFGKSQHPIKMLIEKRAEAYENNSMLKELFNMETSKHFAEKYTSMTGMDGFMPTGQDGEYPVDGMQESFSKTLEHMTWKNSFPISREIIDDSNTIELRKRPKAFVAGYYRTREQFGAALYGAAIAGQSSVNFRGKTFDATCADGKPLFHKQHPSKINKKVQSNVFSDAFSNRALIHVEAAMQKFLGDNDEELSIMPTTILIPNDALLKEQVLAAIGADKDPNTANNGFNINFGRWNVIIWTYLDKYVTAGTKPWIVLADDYNKECGGAIWLDRTALEIRSELASNDANVWKGYSRFTAGFHDWRFAAIGGVEGGTTLVAGA